MVIPGSVGADSLRPGKLQLLVAHNVSSFLSQELLRFFC